MNQPAGCPRTELVRFLTGLTVCCGLAGATGAATVLDQLDPSTLNSVGSGDWNAAATWDAETVVPDADLRAAVGNHLVTVDGEATALSLAIDGTDGGVVIGVDGTLTLMEGVELLAGRLYVDGTLNAESAQIAAGTFQIGSTGTAVLGDVELGKDAEYVYTLGGPGGGLLAVGDVDLHPGATLNVTSRGLLKTVGDATVPIIVAIGRRGVVGKFGGEPPGGAHLGCGVFLSGRGASGHGVTYSANAVGVDVFQAAAGDTDGNRQVDGDDIQAILAADTFPSRGAAGWSTGDFTGDGLCDGDDIQAVLALGLFGQGSYLDRMRGRDPLGRSGDQGPSKADPFGGSALTLAAADTSGSPGTTRLVPEPPAVLTLAVGLLLLLWRRRAKVRTNRL